MIVSPGWGSWPEANWMIFCEVCRNWDTPVHGLWPFWPCDPRNPEKDTVSTKCGSTKRCSTVPPHRPLVVQDQTPYLVNSWPKAVPQSPSTCIQPSPNSQHYSSRLTWSPVLLWRFLKKAQRANSELLSPSRNRSGIHCLLAEPASCLQSGSTVESFCWIMVDIWPKLQLWLLQRQNSAGRGSWIWFSANANRALATSWEIQIQCITCLVPTFPKLSVCCW